MYFQIREIILWPRIPEFQPRRLSFNLDTVNVISGASKTGKSAIVPIIDYCLGSEKCRIPVKTIRDSCEWFGVIIQTSGGQKLFARREPGSQKATGDMFVMEGPTVDVPARAEKNTTVEAVKKTLDALAGLTSLDFDAEQTGSGYKGRPSFRDMAAFIFQPQNVVANPEVFFFKAETQEHQEKLRTVFPYVLGAITPQLLAKQHELAELRRELRRKERELAEVRNVSERWLAEMKAIVTEASELGLVQEPVSTSASREELIEILRKVAASPVDQSHATPETIGNAVKELVDLQKEESQISLELSGLRRRLSEMTTLRDSTIQFQGALQIQRDRLNVADWLKKTHDESKTCPVCGNGLSQATAQLDALLNSLRQIEETAGQFNVVPAAFEREFVRVGSDIRTCAEKLNAVRIRRHALENRSSEAQQYQYEALRVSRFVGNLERSLQTYSRLGADSDLSQEITQLSSRVQMLEDEIKEGRVENRTRRALATVNANAQRFFPDLDMERPNDPVSLSINDLTIRIGSLDRDDYLWEIGSGANWLSYHVAVSLGLQQFFLSLSDNPVPNFIIYDQPSQVYFPRRLAADQQEDSDPKLKDEDIDAVKKVFKVLASAISNSNRKLQIIVLDHAAENVWGDVSGVHLVEEWRNGVKLVPENWIR
jgi:hypothetical protein